MVYGLKNTPAGATWHFQKTGEKWSVLLKVSDGTNEFKGSFGLNAWALPKPEPVFLQELK